MISDVETTHRLELLSPVATSNTSKGNHSSLFSLLDNCCTGIGKRTLRARILEPICDVPEIKMIQGCIQELRSANPELFHQLHQILDCFYCVDRLCKLTMIVPQVKINTALHLQSG